MILCHVRLNSARFQLQLGGSNARELRIEGDSRKIGNVNEGIVEGGEDAGNAENELACVDSQIPCSFSNFFISNFLQTYHHRRGGRGRRSP